MRIRRGQVYKCEICGNIVDVLHAGGGKLFCCGQKMELLEENTVDAATEKHVPVIEEVEGGLKVSVGEVAHPMAEGHYIEWIELVADGTSHHRFLEPGQVPEALFPVAAGDVTARAYCNLHGHWRG